MNFSEVISRFAVAAHDYCLWLESAPTGRAHEHFTATRLIAELYAAALFLPDTEPTDEGSVLLDPGDRQAIVERLKTFPFQYYWEIFQPIALTPEDAVCGDITDDLGDIYFDVKEGLLLYPRNEQAAAWHWRLTFGFHWGRHATSALRALHAFDPESE